MRDTAQAPEIRECIRECESCQGVCLETLNRCLGRGGPADPEQLRLLLDCAEICQTSANFMRRNSELHVETCRACAAVCERCAESCERDADDRALAACAAVCRRCAESCRKLCGAE